MDNDFKDLMQHYLQPHYENLKINLKSSFFFQVIKRLYWYQESIHVHKAKATELPKKKGAKKNKFEEFMQKMNGKCMQKMRQNIINFTCFTISVNHIKNANHKNVSNLQIT